MSYERTEISDEYSKEMEHRSFIEGLSDCGLLPVSIVRDSSAPWMIRWCLSSTDLICQVSSRLLQVMSLDSYLWWQDQKLGSAPVDSLIKRLLDDPHIRPRLLDKINVDRMFIAFIAEHLGSTDKDFLKSDFNVNLDKVDWLLDVVSREGHQAYLSVRNALEETRQNVALSILDAGENKHNLVKHCQPAGCTSIQYTNVSSTKDGQTSCRMKDEITRRLAQRYHEHNERHRVLKDLKHYEDFTNDLTRNFTTLTLERDQGDFRKQDNITLKSALEGEKTNILLTGPPGIGKSSVILQIILLWAEKQKKQAEASQILQHSQLSQKELLIYVEPKHCTNSLDDTILTALESHCGRQLAKEAFSHFQTRKGNVALIFESLDEIYHLQHLISEIRDEMNDQNCFFVAAARSLHPVLEQVKDLPSLKTIHVAGFDENRIYEFVDKFFSSNLQLLGEFKQSIALDVKLKSILHTPLMLVLISFLLIYESLKVKDLQGITKFQIFYHLEQLISKRDGIKLDILPRFHQFALQHLLGDEIKYKADIADLGDKLPFIIFEKNLNLLKADKGPIVSWSHRSFLEYTACKYLSEAPSDIRDIVLTFICSQRKLNYVLALAVDMLDLSEGECEGLVNTILATQSNIEEDTGSTMQCCCDRNNQIRSVMDDLSPGDILSQEELTSTTYNFKAIFPCKVCLNETSFLATKEGFPVLNNCFLVLNGLQQNTEVFSRTLLPLLPASSTWDNGCTYTILPVPHQARCVVLNDGIDNKNRSGFRDVYTAGFTDLIEAGALNVTRNIEQHKALKALFLVTDMTYCLPNMYCPEIIPTDIDSYRRFVSWITQAVCLVGRCELAIKQHPSVNYGPLLYLLPSYFTRFYDGGVRLLTFQGGFVSLQEVKNMLTSIKELGWKVDHGTDIDGDQIAVVSLGSYEMHLVLVKTRITSCEDDQLRQEVEATGILGQPVWA